MTDIGRIHYGDAAVSDDFHDVVRADESGRIRIDADTERERIQRKRAEQTAEAVRAGAALIDHEPVRQAQPRRQRDIAHTWRRPMAAAAEHVFGQYRGASSNAADRNTF